MANEHWKTMPFVPARLKLAREARGLDQAALQRVTVLPIEGFEGSTVIPSIWQILVVALALGMPPAFFTKPMEPEGKGVGFACDLRTLCDNEACGNLAAAACDFPLPGGGTCDKKMCLEHGKRVGYERDFCFEHYSIRRAIEDKMYD
jgi:hypothetical protein